MGGLRMVCMMSWKSKIHNDKPLSLILTAAKMAYINESPPPPPPPHKKQNKIRA